MTRTPRGRPDDEEPEWPKEPPKKLVFGEHVVCPVCRGRKTKRKRCGLCGGTGVIHE